MGDDLKEADFTADRISEVREAVRALMQQDGLTNSVVARESNIGMSTVSSFLADKYIGRNDNVAMQLQRWMTARLASASVRLQKPVVPTYVRTRTSEAFANVLEHAQFTPDFSVISGSPGLGKTITARTYTRTGHNAWMVTAQPTGGSANQIVGDLATALDISLVVGYRSAAMLNRLIIRRLEGLRALVIVDEAQHLTSQALDQLRTYHDLALCGVVLMGNHSIFRRLEGGVRSADFAQLFSRVGMRVDRKRPHTDDIEQLLNAWGIEDEAVRRVARAVARKPGALRTMTKALVQAVMRARNDDKPVTEAHMLAAVRQLGDDKPLELDA